MSKHKKWALMFMTSFLTSVFVLYSFVHLSLDRNWLSEAAERSDYVTQVYFEVVESLHQTIVEYGIEMNALDDVFTLEHVTVHIQDNLEMRETKALDTDVMLVLHDVIDDMGITFTEDVNKGMLELAQRVTNDFTHRTRFPLQERLKTLNDQTRLYRWMIWFTLMAFVGYFLFQTKRLSKREQTILVLSILGTWLVLYLLWWTQLNVSQLQVSPISLKSLLIEINNVWLSYALSWTFVVLGSCLIVVRIRKINKV